MTNNNKFTFYDNFSKNALSNKIHQKGELNYLPWSDAWEEVLKLYPDAIFEIQETEVKRKFYERDEQGQVISEVEEIERLPYTLDKNLGYLVRTQITIEGKTFKMLLPVMNSSNRSMKDKTYSYSTKYGNKQVEPATMMDINKTIMRCLVKNLAMFGLGIHIYKGEDLPDGVKAEIEEKQNENIGAEQYEEITDLYNEVKPEDEKEISFFKSQVDAYLKKKTGKIFDDLEKFNLNDYEIIKKALEAKKKNLQQQTKKTD
jgi:hypothetical protein